MPHIVWLQFGSNLGDRRQHLESALQYFGEPSFKLLAASDIYETEAWGQNPMPPFYNQIIKVETQLKPQNTLKYCLNVEYDMGRESKGDYQPRTIDIDILFYDAWVVMSKELKIPHRGIKERRFILQILNDLDPNFIHPVDRISVKELLNQCKDILSVNVIS